MALKLAAAGLLALAALAGCATTPSTVTADNGRSWAFRCPPAGTVIRDSNGGRVTYLGEAGPGLCRRSDGQTAIYGLWFAPRGQQPDPRIVAWLGELFPASAGRSATSSSLGRSIDRPDSQMWVRDARVVGFETLDLPAGRHETVLIEWDDRGMAGNTFRGRYRRWLDTETGALVQSEMRIVAGLSNNEHFWRAVAIERARPIAQSVADPAVAQGTDQTARSSSLSGARR